MSRSLVTDLLPPESAYRFSETFGKKLVGRTGIEDALERLKTVTEEEARMAAAEALKVIHDVGDRVQGIHDAVREFKETKQGGDDRVKGIGDMVAIGAQKMLNLLSLSSMLILLCLENIGRQMTSNPEAMDAETLKTTNEANNKIEYVDNMTQDNMHDTLEAAEDGAGNADNVQGPMKETEARGVEGAHIIRNLSSELIPSVL